MLGQTDFRQSKAVSVKPELNLLEWADHIRCLSADGSDDETRSRLGQFFTPFSIARLMSSMIIPTERKKLRLLDAGAGTGMLTAGCISHICRQKNKPDSIEVTAVELDPVLIDSLRETINRCRSECDKNGIEFSAHILNEDFIDFAVEKTLPLLNGNDLSQFDLAVLNPPYAKINTRSAASRMLRHCGIIVPNLYAAFLALSAELLGEDGQLVAITPRSFCNGTYFKPFRRFLSKRLNFHRFHLFESRKEIFDDNILQENVIFSAVKNKNNMVGQDIIISTSFNGETMLHDSIRIKADQLIDPDDKELFIHLGGDENDQNIVRQIKTFQTSLEDLGLMVSTGRVVDFRVKEFLKNSDHGAFEDTVPLIYPHNIKKGKIKYPVDHPKKFNSIEICPETESVLVKSGTYVLVKRFSSKEEKRRITAALFNASDAPGEWIGFENHLNYFHSNGEDIEAELAKGLVIFLNSSLLDNYFRRFSGHTQVNAADLRYLKYPAKDELKKLGTCFTDALPSQAEIDELIARIVSNE